MHDTDGWPRLSEELVNALPMEERSLIRQHEDEMIAANAMAVDDIIENCHVKPQFAKTYRVLRRDKRETLEKLRSGLAQPHAEYSDAYRMALLRSADAILDYKLSLMSQHFFLRWGEPVENWAGTEGSVFDRGGCLVVLSLLGSAGVTQLCCLFF